MPTKSLKERIGNKEPVVGVYLPLAIDLAQLNALLERRAYDFVATDCQHAALNEEKLVAFCAVADRFDIPVQLRIKHTRHTYMIGNYLDLGPSGIEVPQVENEATVREAIANFYYPPTGIRSWGGVARKSIAQNPDRHSYAKWWSEFGALWLQLESVNAVIHAVDFALPGVDVLDFGPMDLMFNIETYSHPVLRTVDECIKHVAEQVKHLPVALSFRSGSPEHRKKYEEMGVSVFIEQPQS